MVSNEVTNGLYYELLVTVTIAVSPVCLSVTVYHPTSMVIILSTILAFDSTATIYYALV